MKKERRTSFTVEMLVSDIMNDFADEHELERDFYGDCYPTEIMELEVRMKYMTEEELEEAVDQLKEDLKAWYL